MKILLDSPARQYKDVDVAKTQGPHHLPDEPRIQAVVLREQGYSTPHIAEVIGVPQTTVWGWLRRSEEAAKGNKPVMDRHARVALQALDLIQDGLDIIEEDDTRTLAYKNLAVLNTLAGTSTDKLQRESSPVSTQQNVLIIVRADRPMEPPAIEGELA